VQLSLALHPRRQTELHSSQPVAGGGRGRKLGLVSQVYVERRDVGSHPFRLADLGVPQRRNNDMLSTARRQL
jgi:hypothetical protein